MKHVPGHDPVAQSVLVCGRIRPLVQAVCKAALRQPRALSPLIFSLALMAQAQAAETTYPYTDGTLNSTAGHSNQGGNGTLGPGDHGSGTAGQTPDGVIVTLTGSNSGVQISSGSSVGVLANSAGGNGGNGAPEIGDDGGYGGNGGAGGAVSITGTGIVNVTTTGNNAIGVQASSVGGAGGFAGSQGSDAGYAGGVGGSGGAVTVDWSAAAGLIKTSGANAFGISAVSIAGDSGSNGTNYITLDFGDQSNGPNGADSGLVNVTTGGAMAVSTGGLNAVGIVVRGVSGNGGDGTSSAGPLSTGTGGRGGNGGVVAALTVSNAGAITTTGTGGLGIFVQSVAGRGGQGGNTQDVGGSDAGQAGNGGTPGTITISNSGTLTTSGAYAVGMLAQSVSGSGGIGGSANGLFDAHGGSGGTTPDGGAITISHSGSIVTTGANSQGIVAQSLGGGGGMGGDAGGMLGIDGGTGGLGGNGGAVTISSLSGVISTSNQLSQGVVAQSIGGGGGMGGVATGAGAIAASAVGGNGGVAGNGGTVTVNSNGLTLTAAGTGSTGILAQSIGGGGGAGGGAYTTSAGPIIDVAVAVGGKGAHGGNGGTAGVTVQNSSISTGSAGQTAQVTFNGAVSTVSLPATDSHGLVVQSIGGGGGNGGAGSAAAYAIAVPNGSEDPAAQITVSAAFSTGGAAAIGGNGGHATGTVNNSSSITTAGDGSIGAMVQSIGGGGGNGGDSSALAATIGYGVPLPFVSKAITPSTNAVSVSHSVGGAGAAGGDGSTAAFILGNSGGPASSITTRGDAAIGVLAQSIGGGGGNGGVGNAAVKSWSTSQNAVIKIGLGGSGGAGGNGGTTTVNAYAGDIITYGHGSEAILAQSIGGGGGVGSGSAINVTGLDAWADAVSEAPSGEDPDSVAADIAVGMKVTRQFTIGAVNGAGGTGGTVNVSHSGVIQTYGKDSAGIVAQSIGDGGGSGGSAGADSSTGIVPGIPSSTGGSDDDGGDGGTITVPVNINSTIALGSTNWSSSGIGGLVTVTAAQGQIQTAGDHSTGIIAQSIGGGGGRGRVVTVGAETGSALDLAAQLTVNTAIQLGGTSGLNGANEIGQAGAVQLNLSNYNIYTGQLASGTSEVGSGLHAYGILAQSIGAGGGQGIDGSADPNGSATLGANIGLYSVWGSSSGGMGNSATLSIGAGDAGVTTYGDGGHGVVLQSIGGGGGVAAFGASSSAVPEGSGRKIEISLGTTVAANDSGIGLGLDGGAVALTADADAALTILTSGTGAFGIVAQSIGGGGGMVGVSQGVKLSYKQLGMSITGSPNGNIGGNGGTVNLTLPASTMLSTTGTGSHAIVAQSIGGGGGLVTAYQNGQTSTLGGSAPAGGAESVGNGGHVTVSTNGQVQVSGAGAYGILAQSVAGGGGVFTVGSDTYIGQTGGARAGAAGTVTVNVLGAVSAIGDNGIGIVAQSRGPDAGGSVVINVGGDAPGSVTGGTGHQGVAILVDGGNSNNKITIAKNSWIWAASGSAIKTTGTYGTQKVDVDNQGEIYGNTWLQGGSISGNFQNPNGRPPDALSGTLTNAGALIAMPGQRNYLDGHLVQTASGRIVPHLDFGKGVSGQYVVTGNAVLDGSIAPTLVSALPGIYLPILTVEGTETGSLRAEDSPLFSYDVRASGNRRDIAINGTHFAAPALGLNKHKAGVARTLENVFAAGSYALGGFFAGLDQAARSNLADYRDAIAELSPRSTMTLLSRAAGSASRIADAAMSCPEFAPGAGQAILPEGECAYLTTRGNITSLSGDDDRGSARLKSFALQGGGQRQIRPGLLLGGALAYQADDFSSHSDGVSADGNSVQGAITLKQTSGPWLFSGALFGNYGEFDIKRRIAAPGLSVTAKGTAPVYSAGLRARVAYTAGTEQLYVRPSVNLDLVHAGSGSFTEKGAGDLGLKVASSSYNTAILTPELEIGNRYDMKDGGVLRSFALVGVSLRSNDDWTGRAAFKGGVTSPSFGMQSPLDSVALRLGAGVQLYANERVSVQLRYDAELGSEAKSHNASAKFAYRF